MQPESSLPRSQQPATRPYPEPDQSNSRSPSCFLEIHFMSSFRYLHRSNGSVQVRGPPFRFVTRFALSVRS
jgi:hypothetical protein